VSQEAFRHLELAEVLHKQLLNDLDRRGLGNFAKDKVAELSRDQRAGMLQRAAEIIGHLDQLNSSFAASPDDWLNKRGALIGRVVTGSPGDNLQDVLLSYHAGLAMNPQLQVNPREVAGHLEKALEYSDGKPEMTRELSIQLGRACLRLGNPERGITGMRRIITEEPNNAGVVELYGVLHGAAGDHEKAEPILKRALELSGDDERTRGSVYHNLGLLYLQLENSSRAIEHFEEAVLLNPDNGPAKKILEELRARKEP
jgi:tetratricopeptide (TPR) repeat protein